MSIRLSDLANPPMTMAEVDAMRRGKPIEKGPSRLEVRTEDIRQDKADERRWKKEVTARDGHVCRSCKCRVVKQLALAPNRLEVHHVAGRADQAVRWDVRNGMVLCATCHERVTRNQLLIIQAAKFLFRIAQTTYINASKALKFQEAA